jgi:3-phosphoglycerate kinase|tara:strand:- start:1180 stop:2370 length:1191 start_codon:yes stop_codon:yes gene_type:complete
VISTVTQLELKRQRILVRVDFNVPLENDLVADDFRVRSALPTINYCLEEGASLILMSHLGRPGGMRKDELSLIPVGETLSDLLELPIKFSEDCVSEDAVDVSHNLVPGEVHLLENLRFHAGETSNDPEFARKLSRHSSKYINDAFGTAHRAHASNVGVALSSVDRAAGLLMEKEYHYLHQAVTSPKRPLTIILGGAKIGTKLSLIRRFLREADNILIGGGMAFTFLKADGQTVGQSLVEDEMIDTAKNILEKSVSSVARLRLPLDFVVTDDVASGRAKGEKNMHDIEEDEIGVDIGEQTMMRFKEVIDQSATVIWNGPMGIFEVEAFSHGTAAMTKTVAAATSRGATTILGGGDTAAAVRKFRQHENISHISTGGGASLALLAGADLPAFEALGVS